MPNAYVHTIHGRAAWHLPGEPRGRVSWVGSIKKLEEGVTSKDKVEMLNLT